ncbi:MAG: nitrous oxide reductase accessory protein NosL [Owenweeksia sp.]|nr:nitrous oxide reductase accessory protein NosL [Owenweeksia sp.]
MKTIVLCILACLVISCTPEAREINYGEEACSYCRMTIVDERYAAQLVSSKNKAHSFDATECMIRYKNENEDRNWALELVTDYARPKELIPAGDAYIIRSKKLPSPMGMYLTATGSRKAAKALQKKHGGQVHSYPKVADDLDKLPAL